MGKNFYPIHLFIIFLFALAFACDDPSPDQQALEKKLNGKALPAFAEIPAWVGTFQGTLPCPDCDGILTQVEIKRDSSFKKSVTYLGKGSGLENTFSNSGKCKPDSQKEIIWLIGNNENQHVGFVCLGDSAIHLTDAHGKLAISTRTLLYRIN